MDKKYYDDLRNAVLNASDAALEYSLVPDDGTCNFDKPIIFLPAEVDDGMLKSHGVPVNKITYGFFKGCYSVQVPLYGQAGRRTRMAEAAVESLNDAGFNATVWYNMD